MTPRTRGRSTSKSKTKPKAKRRRLVYEYVCSVCEATWTSAKVRLCPKCGESGAVVKQSASGRPSHKLAQRSARAGAGRRLPDVTVAQKAAFVEAFRIEGTILHAAKQADVGRRTVYDWMKADPEFADACKAALEDFTDTLEKEAWRRAVDGVEEPIVGRIDKDLDGVVTTVRKYSDRLLERLLQGNRAEKFNRQRVEHTGKDGEPIATTLDLSKLSREDLEFLSRVVKSAASKPELAKEKA